MLPIVQRQGIRRAVPNALEGAEYNILKRTLPDADQVIRESLQRARQAQFRISPAFRPYTLEIPGGSTTGWKGYGAVVRAEKIATRKALRGKWNIE